MCSCACEAHITTAYLETEVTAVHVSARLIAVGLSMHSQKPCSFVQYATATCLSGPTIVTTLSSHSGVGSSILILVPVSFRKSRMISPPYQQM